MRSRDFGILGPVSALTLGGGGIGQVWGQTTREESVATVLEAVDLGIDFLDVAPGYGNGEAELVIGEAFRGRLPDGVKVSTKCRLGNPEAVDVAGILERSLAESLERMMLDRVDLFFLHNMIIPDGTADNTYQGTPRSLFVEVVRPVLEDLREKRPDRGVGNHGHRRAGLHSPDSQGGPAARGRSGHHEPARLSGRSQTLRWTGAAPGYHCCSY